MARTSDEANERRRRRIRKRRSAEIEGEIAEEVPGSSWTKDLEKRREQHRDEAELQCINPPRCKACDEILPMGLKGDDPCPICGEKEPWQTPAVLHGLPPHGSMPKLRYPELSRCARLGIVLARWSFRWKRWWRRLWSKPPIKSYYESIEEDAGVEWEKRKKKLLDEKEKEDNNDE